MLTKAGGHQGLVSYVPEKQAKELRKAWSYVLENCMTRAGPGVKYANADGIGLYY